MKKTEKQDTKAVLKISEHKRKRADDLETDIDTLFQLPLTEFTGGRNALAARLKKNGRGDEAVRVKALAKPPISAWAVNQLYWNHREAFDRLFASGERFHKAQTSGKVADMRASLDARREVLSELSETAASVLRDADHNPSLDTLHRITTTLEGMSVYASRSDGPRPGRLTHDVDPPGFESFGSFVPSLKSVPPAVTGGSKSVRQRQTHPLATAGGTDLTTTKLLRNVPNDDARQAKDARKTKIAAAKVSLQDATKSLTQARAKAQSLESALKKAESDAQKAEKHRRDAEEELRKAKAASEDAARRARSVAVEMEDAARAVVNAERSVEKAAKELELLIRESSRR